MNTEQIIKALECCSTREGDCENCPLDKATTMNCQWVLLSLCLDVIKEFQAHNENLQNDNKYLRGRLAEEAEIKEDLAVVRCKDCRVCDFCYPVKNKGEETKEGYYCNHYKEWVSPNHYCSYGERKNDMSGWKAAIVSATIKEMRHKLITRVRSYRQMDQPPSFGLFYQIITETTEELLKAPEKENKSEKGQPHE